MARLVKTGPLLVVEENVPAGGLGEAVLKLRGGTGEHREVATLSAGPFVQHGPQSEAKLSGLDAESIAERVRRLVKEAYDR